MDIVWFLSSPAVNVSLTSGVATGEGTDSLSLIENIRGSEAADTLIGDGNPNSIDGGGGGDTIEGRAGFDASDAHGIAVNSTPYPGLTGGAGNDSITGNNGDDFLVGGAGTGDVLSGGAHINGDRCENIPGGQTRTGCEFGT